MWDEHRLATSGSYFLNFTTELLRAAAETSPRGWRLCDWRAFSEFRSMTRCNAHHTSCRALAAKLESRNFDI